MPNNAQVYIHYGPYETCGIVDHKVSRLDGLQTVLKKEGHTVHLVEIPDWNVVEMYVNGEMIFSCDIRILDYGGDGELDQKCHEALEAVRVAF